MGWGKKTKTNCIPQTKIEKVRPACVRLEMRSIFCSTSRSRNRNRGDSIVPTRKRQDETNDVQIEIEKKDEKKKEQINSKNARRQNARGIRILQARKERGGGVAPRRNNRIPESATKESREAKIKSKKAIQETNGKRQDERTNERKRNRSCLLYTSPSPRDLSTSRMPSSA